jgi:hypothetical protein
LIENQDTQPAPGGPVAPSEDADGTSALQAEDAGLKPRAPEEDDVDLAIANAALAAENRQLKQAAQSQQLGKLLGELRFLGKLTPGLEQAGVAEIMQAVWEAGSAGFQPAAPGKGSRQDGGTTGITVALPDGREVPLGEAIAGLLYAIPPSWGGEGYASGGGSLPPSGAGKDARRAAAPTEYHSYAPLPPRLSPTERDIARTLGLTAEEYIGITAEG